MIMPSSRPNFKSLTAAAAIIGSIAIFVFGWTGHAERPDQIVFMAQSFRSILLSACLPLLSLLWGYTALKFWLRRSGASDSIAPISLSLALGWGLLSHVLWLMAAAGSLFPINLFQPWVAFLMVAVSVLLLRNNLYEIIRNLTPRIRFKKRDAGTIAGIIILLFIMALILRLVLTALTPSFLYDVLEYHLPDARWILSTGSLKPIPGNAYSLMPQGIEILYAFGHLLEGQSVEHAPKLIHLFLGLSTCFLLNAILKEFAVAAWLRFFAVLLFLSHPISFKLSADAYVDFGTALFGAAAIYSWLRSARLKQSIYLSLAAVFMGFALSVKYPALGVLVLPFLFVLIPLTPREANPSFLLNKHYLIRISGLALFLGLIALATYSPWLIRALAIDFSPFPPLTLPGIFPQDYSPEAAIRQFMAQAHQTVSPFSFHYWNAVVHRYHYVGLIWFVAALFFLLFPRSDKRLRGMSLLVIAGYLFWNLWPDSADRFLSPLLPVFIALGIVLVHEMSRLLPRYGRLIVLPLLLWGFLSPTYSISRFGFPIYAQTLQAIDAQWLRAGLGQISSEMFLRTQLGITADFFRAVNRAAQEHPNPKILLLYEARSAAIKVPTVSNTIFDPSLLWLMLRSEVGKDPKTMLELLRRQGITHIAVNEVELSRLLKTYPVSEARKDPVFQQADSLPAPGGFQPAFLPLRKYYAPFYYYSDNNTQELERRLDAFLQQIQQNTVWEENLDGARMFVSPIVP